MRQEFLFTEDNNIYDFIAGCAKEKSTILYVSYSLFTFIKQQLIEDDPSTQVYNFENNHFRINNLPGIEFCIDYSIRGNRVIINPYPILDIFKKDMENGYTFLTEIKGSFAHHEKQNVYMAYNSSSREEDVIDFIIYTLNGDSIDQRFHIKSTDPELLFNIADTFTSFGRAIVNSYLFNNSKEGIALKEYK